MSGYVYLTILEVMKEIGFYRYAFNGKNQIKFTNDWWEQGICDGPAWHLIKVKE
jgi:hypothetical protein